MTNPRTLAAFVHDLVAAVLAWMLAFALRFNFHIPAEFYVSACRSLFWVLPLFGVLFLAFGLYRGLWRFASLSDLQHLVSAVITGALLTTAAVVFLGLGSIPRSVLVLHPLLLALTMGGSRFAYRSWKEHRLYGPARMRGLNRSGLWYAVALVDDNPAKVGRRLRGLPVFGPLARVGEVAEKYGVKHVIMALPGAKSSERRS